jgi:hypothetical protein
MDWAKKARPGNSDDEGHRESAEQRVGHDPGPARDPANPLSQARSQFVVVGGAGRKNPAQVDLAEDDDVIEALMAAVTSAS